MDRPTTPSERVGEETSYSFANRQLSGRQYAVTITALTVLHIGRNRLVSMVKYIEFFALHSQPDSVKRQIEDWCCVERQQLTDDEASHYTDPERLPEL
jgi:hypothetical protein